MTMQDVQVTIDLQKPSGRLSFGMPLILGVKAGGHNYKEYESLEEVAVDFAPATAEHGMATALFAQGNNAPARIAIVGRAETEDAVVRLRTVLDRGWYYLLTTSTEVKDIEALATAIEGENFRVFVARVQDKVKLDALKVRKLERTALFYHTDVKLYPDAALVGSVGSADVGSVTWKFKECRGIPALALTSTELKAIHDAGALTYVEKHGQARTSEGKTLSGEYIDVVMSRDFVRSSIEQKVQQLLNQAPKVPYTNAGIVQVENTVRSVLHDAYRTGIIATDENDAPMFGTTFLRREKMSPQDIASRVYTGGSFWFVISGAVHQVRIKGVIRY
ncbi:DUF3383 family protein [Paenibacillus sp. 481]|uniref:DUF3383 family protein n=1 Tax=Paenibacillus sp. 481 TaxID=2835869 RepID=UPI001E5C532B|nr:DUF3383 family protein [Paenibacillus sp. 481]UHA71933.1 DUF3383 family protein [Paenibacillus sp. 481]